MHPITFFQGPLGQHSKGQRKCPQEREVNVVIKSEGEHRSRELYVPCILGPQKEEMVPFTLLKLGYAMHNSIIMMKGNTRLNRRSDELAIL